MSRCVKSGKSRGALACTFLVGAWQKLLCRLNRHDDGMGTWFDLILVTDGQGSSGTLVGTRIDWTCACCYSSHHLITFASDADRLRWHSTPGNKRRMMLRDWSA
jgi:hypothetical protein